MRQLHTASKNKISQTSRQCPSSRNYAVALVAAVLLIYLFGSTMLYSTSSISSGSSFFTKQLIWGTLGVIGGISVWLIGYRKISQYTIPILIIVFLMLVVARFFFDPVNGAYRWIKVPRIGNIQPSEFAKLAAILFSAKYCAENIRFLNSFAPFFKKLKNAFFQKRTWITISILAVLSGSLAANSDAGLELLGKLSLNQSYAHFWYILTIAIFLCFVVLGYSFKNHTLVKSSIPVVLLMIAVMAGKDLGTTFLIGLVYLTVVFAAGVRMVALAIPTVAIGTPVFFIIKYFDAERWSRLTSFLNPEAVQSDDGFQLWRSLLALGSGGMTGIGFTESRIKDGWLPEDHTDFILSIIGEELGFVFMCLIIVFYLVIMFLGVKISARARSKQGMLLGIGLTSLIIYQSFINIGVVSGSLPTKGMPAAFISYGGSNLIFCFICIGFIVSIATDSSYPNYNDRVRAKLKSLISKKKQKRRSTGKRHFKYD